MLLLRAEDYYGAPRESLGRALGFLGLAVPDEAGWSAMLAGPVERAGPRPAGGAPPIPPSMVSRLRAFYRPGLTELVTSLAAEPDAELWHAWAEDG